ncbi:MAG: histidine kinase, partial [Acidobacteria bacterium]|nr:histidine kinase [Acidobacteriota bacterium]
MKASWRKPLQLLSADPALQEQTEYNSRRLAKLGATVADVVAWLSKRVPAEQVRTIELILTRSYVQVREAEVALFEELFRAELESAGLAETLRCFEAALQTYARANSVSIRYPQPVSSSRPKCETGEVTTWSVPLNHEGLIELRFDKPYPWLPRELAVLRIAAERCLAAGEKARREEQSRRLAGTLTEVAERERRRISQELHDEAGQSLLVIRLSLEMLEQALDGPTRDRAREARQMTEHVVNEIRRILSALSPEVLTKLGLAPAVRQLSSRLRWVQPAQVSMQVSDLPRLPEKLELVVYRLAQECLNNAARHAEAKNVTVSLN